MAKKYTCFVISPIGKEGSEVRRDADDVFKYVIADSLSEGFVVERADHIPGITDTITNEMVSRIQNSDLCIIDLTGLNPNVMYECGRRHETGKPSILIGQQDPANLPFDVGAFQYIQYSLDESDYRRIYDLREKIRGNVEHFVEIGFDRVGGASIEDVSRRLDIIDGKLDAILKGAHSLGGLAGTPATTDVSALIREIGGLVPAINYAMSQQDAALLDALLPRVPNQRSENFVTVGLVQGAIIGSRVAFEMLQDVARTTLDDLPLEAQSRVVSGYAAGASRLDREADAVGLVESFATNLLRRAEGGEDIPRTTLAGAFNAWQRLLHGLGRFQEALRVARQTLEWEPEEPAYAYNAAINARGAQETEQEEEFVDKFVGIMRAAAFSDPDDDHLEYAIRAYHRLGRTSEALEMFAVLQVHYPRRASMLHVDDDLKGLFASH